MLFFLAFAYGYEAGHYYKLVTNTADEFIIAAVNSSLRAVKQKELAQLSEEMGHLVVFKLEEAIDDADKKHKRYNLRFDEKIYLTRKKNDYGLISGALTNDNGGWIIEDKGNEIYRFKDVNNKKERYIAVRSKPDQSDKMGNFVQIRPADKIHLFDFKMVEVPREEHAEEKRRIVVYGANESVSASPPEYVQENESEQTYEEPVQEIEEVPRRVSEQMLEPASGVQRSSTNENRYDQSYRDQPITSENMNSIDFNPDTQVTVIKKFTFSKDFDKNPHCGRVHVVEM